MAGVRPTKTGLISWYTMDEGAGQTRVDSHNALDASDNNTVGTVAGVVGNAADYTPSDYHSVPDNALHNWTDTLSILFWYNPDNVSGEDALITKWLPNSQNEWAIELSGNELKIFVAPTLSNPGNVHETTDAANLTAGNDFFCIMEYDGTQVAADRVKFYVNNSLEASTTTGGTIPASLQNGTGQIEFGRFSSIGRPLDGQLDEIVIAKRTYTTDEKSWFYNGGDGRTYADLADFTPRVIIF